MNLKKLLMEQYQEEFYRPKNSLRLLTKSEAKFLRSLIRFKETKLRQEITNETKRKSIN